MSSITLQDVTKLAALSALRLTDTQTTALQKDIEELLGYFEQLQTVDTEGVEPTYEVHGLETVTRADEVQDYHLSRDELLCNAPHHDGQSIVVPRVIE